VVIRRDCSTTIYSSHSHGGEILNMLYVCGDPKSVSVITSWLPFLAHGYHFILSERVVPHIWGCRLDGLPLKCFQSGTTSKFCLSFSGFWRCNANGRSQNAKRKMSQKREMSCYGNNHKNCVSFVAMSPFHLCFFSHCINKTMRRTAISSHCLAASLRLCLTVTCGKTCTTVTWRAPLQTCYHVIVTE